MYDASTTTTLVPHNAHTVIPKVNVEHYTGYHDENCNVSKTCNFFHEIFSNYFRRIFYVKCTNITL